jgi:hypothetical protein
LEEARRGADGLRLELLAVDEGMARHLSPQSTPPSTPGRRAADESAVSASPASGSSEASERSIASEYDKLLLLGEQDDRVWLDESGLSVEPSGSLLQSSLAQVERGASGALLSRSARPARGAADRGRAPRSRRSPARDGIENPGYPAQRSLARGPGRGRQPPSPVSSAPSDAGTRLANESADTLLLGEAARPSPATAALATTSFAPARAGSERSGGARLARVLAQQ